MKSSYAIDLVASTAAVWESLTDLDVVLTRLPGAVLERDGDAVTGSVKTKLGTAQITYRVTARADIGVSGRHVAVVVVSGREARGQGTLAASLTVTVRPGLEPDQTTVDVHADIDATGRGEVADNETWSKVLGTLVAGVLPFEVVPPKPAAPVAKAPGRPVHAPTPRPLPGPSIPQASSGPDRRMIYAAVGIVMLLVVWRRRRRK